MNDSGHSSLLRFDGYVLDPVSEELSKDGEILALSPQPVRVLALLAANSERMVSREEIQRHVWGTTHVEADLGLNSCIRKIRAQLGDDPREPRFIRTLPRRGYHFLATVENGRRDPVSSEPGRSRGVWAAGAALVVVALAGWWFWSSERSSAGSAALDSSESPVVAVLPFEDLAADPGASFLGAGLAEETITRLGGIDPSELAVLARTTAMRLAGDGGDPLERAQQFGAGYVLQGSLKRSDGGLRLNVRLSETASGLQVAAESFEAVSQGLSTQVAVADRVAAWLVEQLAPGGLPTPAAEAPLGPELYEVYLQGLYELRKGTGDGYRTARERFATVVEEVPSHAAAWLGLAEAELWLSWFGTEDPAGAVARAREAGERAIELDADRAAPHALLGYASLYVDFDLEEAGVRLARAVALEPGSSRAQSWYASYLSAVGEHDEAIERAQLSRRLDPLSMGVGADLCWLLNYGRRFAEALVACDSALALRAGDPWTTMGKLEALRQLGRDAEAVQVVTSLASSAGVEAETWVRDAQSHPRAALDDALAWLEERASAGPQAFHAASFAAARGRVPQALDLLDSAVEGAEMLLVFVGVDPRFDSLRAEPAFRDLLVRLGLPGNA